MKKYTNKFLGIILASVALLFTACEDGDQIFDQLQVEVKRGAILRTVNVISNELPIGQSDGVFSVELEIQDQENGALVSAIEVFASFIDNTDGDGPGDAAESLFETVASSDFSLGENGLPRMVYTVTLAELLSATGVAGSAIQGGDQFRVRFELVLVDGRRFSFADNSGPLTGSFFRSPFLYSATIVCPPTVPTAGDWTINFQDSFGDGWNGAEFVIAIDGEVSTFTMDAGASLSTMFSVPAGALTISIQFTGGAFDEEVTGQIISANGNTVVDISPNPPTDTELLDYCLDNL